MALFPLLLYEYSINKYVPYIHTGLFLAVCPIPNADGSVSEAFELCVVSFRLARQL